MLLGMVPFLCRHLQRPEHQGQGLQINLPVEPELGLRIILQEAQVQALRMCWVMIRKHYQSHQMVLEPVRQIVPWEVQRRGRQMLNHHQMLAQVRWLQTLQNRLVMELRSLCWGLAPNQTNRLTEPVQPRINQ